MVLPPLYTANQLITMYLSKLLDLEGELKRVQENLDQLDEPITVPALPFNLFGWSKQVYPRDYFTWRYFYSTERLVESKKEEVSLIKDKIKCLRCVPSSTVIQLSEEEILELN